MPERSKVFTRVARLAKPPAPAAAPAEEVLETAGPGMTNQAMQQLAGTGMGGAFLAASHSVGNQAIQRLAGAGPAPDIGEQIRNASGGGMPLDGGLQRQLEGGLGADLSNVRIHTDDRADQLSKSVNAVAFTTGSDIFFRSGAYDPGSKDGMHVLAHEATHTVQQAAGPVAGTPAAGGVSISDPSDSFEQAAEASAHRISSMPVIATSQAGDGGAAGAGAAVQRVGEDEKDLQMMVQREEDEKDLQMMVQREEDEKDLQMMVQRQTEEQELAQADL